ncbi:ATP-binding protein [Ferrimonas sp. YFM]|uniref:ATP-binding protein n=1 Tax=Ferrimonas sp. YFM TaxID=3028878 RepID=UPI002573B8CB|nr:ATP-binding protein [Ferrimonas sp. YFM]BDY04418.1 histidine kinase [Ferrimonas sp. YFM]
MIRQSLTQRLNLAIFAVMVLLAFVISAWSYKVDLQTMRAHYSGVAGSLAPTMIELVVLDQPETVTEFNRQLRNFPQLRGLTLMTLEGEVRYEYRRQDTASACPQEISWLAPLMDGCMVIRQQLEFESAQWLDYAMEVDTRELQAQIFQQALMVVMGTLFCFGLIYRSIRRWVKKPVDELVAGLPLMGTGQVDFPYAGVHRSELAMLARTLEQSDRQLFERQQQATELNSRLEASLQAKSDFLANASHEIRTPLNAVTGFIECLEAQRTRLTPEGQEQLQLLQGASQSLLHIVNDVLDFSRLEAGELKLDPQPGCPSDFLQRVHAHYQGMARLHKVAFGLCLAPELPPRLVMDEGRLEQILGNLLTNAIKFSPGGQVELKARVQSRDECSCKLAISVEDTGIGIEPHKLAGIFDAYTQADGSVTRRFGGTGLGLAICKRLSLLMQANLEVESEPGQGSRFTLTLSLPLSETGTRSQADDAIGRDERPLQGARVLLAEDNISNQKLMQIMLKRLGCDALTVASNGQQAVDACQRESFDLVLMDCQMPVMDGYRATRQIRLGPSADTLILALTANATEDDRQKCLDSGMDDFLAKPVTLTTLGEGIAAARLRHGRSAARIS